METNRRETLRVVGATAATALAGCATGDGPDDDTPDVDSPAAGSPEDTDVDVLDVAMRPELLVLDDDAYGISGDREGQFLFAELDVDSTDKHPPSSFAVAAGGDEYEALEVPGGATLAGFGDVYGARGDGGSGWLVVQFPKPLHAERVALTWDGGDREFEVDATVVDRLARPPATFAVGVQATEAASVGETVTATVTVENVADVDGRFVGGLNRVGPLVASAPAETILLAVDASGTAAWEYSYTLDDPEIEKMDGSSMRLHLEWRGGSPSRTVDVRTGES